MNKLKYRFLLPTCILAILVNFQVLSQNQSSYCFIINKEKQQAKVALLTLVKEELPSGEYKVEFKMSFLHSLLSDVNYYFLKEIYLDQPSVYHTYNVADSFIQRKKMILVKKYFFLNNSGG